MQREYPPTPIPAVGAIVFAGEQVLVIQRGHPPNQGIWTLPGGVIKVGETMAQAIEREVYEECGLAVQAGPVVAALDFIQYDQAAHVQFHYVLIDLLCHYCDGEITPGDDAAQARWIPRSELAALGVAPRTQAVIAQAWQMLDAPLDCL